MNKLLLLPLTVLLFACSQKAETETLENNGVEKFQFEQIERAKELENIQQERDKQIENILDSQENKVTE